MVANEAPLGAPGTLQDYNAAVDLIERNLAARPDKIAYIDDDGHYSFTELAERVNRCANALTGLGLSMETRVMVCLSRYHRLSGRIPRRNQGWPCTGCGQYVAHQQ